MKIFVCNNSSNSKVSNGIFFLVISTYILLGNLSHVCYLTCLLVSMLLIMWFIVSIVWVVCRDHILATSWETLRHSANYSLQTVTKDQNANEQAKNYSTQNANNCVDFTLCFRKRAIYYDGNKRFIGNRCNLRFRAEGWSLIFGSFDVHISYVL